MLEHVVMTAERSVHSLSRASGVRLATNLQVCFAVIVVNHCCVFVIVVTVTVAVAVFAEDK